MKAAQAPMVRCPTEPADDASPRTGSGPDRLVRRPDVACSA